MAIPLVMYLVLIGVGFVLWLAGRIWPKKLAPFGQILREALSSLPTRIAIAMIWWWLGWHFFTY